MQHPQTWVTASLLRVPLMPLAGLAAKGWREGVGGKGRALIPHADAELRPPGAACSATLNQSGAGPQGISIKKDREGARDSLSALTSGHCSTWRGCLASRVRRQTRGARPAAPTAHTPPTAALVRMLLKPLSLRLFSPHACSRATHVLSVTGHGHRDSLLAEAGACPTARGLGVQQQDPAWAPRGGAEEGWGLDRRVAKGLWGREPGSWGRSAQP